MSDAKLRSTFVAGGGGRVRLLLERSTVRPGAVVAVTVANDSDEPIRYGTFTHIEDADSGRQVEIDGPVGYRLIGLGADQGEVGPCIPVLIPSDTPPGDYRAALADVSRPGGPGATLTAPLEIAGNPLPHPWERRLERAVARAKGF